MPVWRLQTTMLADTPLPRDAFVITPHFRDETNITGPQGLCDDLAAALHTWTANSGTRQITVTAYDAQGTPPVIPQATKTVNANVAPASGTVREVALCLSFFNERNAPRRRGRLYLPSPAFISGGSNMGLRPTATQIAKVGALAPIFAGLGGTDVDWVVYSRLDDQARAVTHWYVDDEWDIIRSRGLRPSSRLEGTTSEA